MLVSVAESSPSLAKSVRLNFDINRLAVSVADLVGLSRARFCLAGFACGAWSGVGCCFSVGVVSAANGLVLGRAGVT
jgi:hypothetical protein